MNSIFETKEAPSADTNEVTVHSRFTRKDDTYCAPPPGMSYDKEMSVKNLKPVMRGHHY